LAPTADQVADPPGATPGRLRTVVARTVDPGRLRKSTTIWNCFVSDAGFFTRPRSTQPFGVSVQVIAERSALALSDGLKGTVAPGLATDVGGPCEDPELDEPDEQQLRVSADRPTTPESAAVRPQPIDLTESSPDPYSTFPGYRNQ
jgi:hypothetical protein